MDYEHLYSTATKALNTQLEINEKQAEQIKQLEGFLRNLIVIDNMLCLLPTPVISKDILPKQGREDSVILLTCDKTSSPELLMKMIDTVLNKL